MRHIVGIILSILKMYTLTCSEHSRKNGKIRVQTQVFLIPQIVLCGIFTNLKKKLGRHGKCSIQLNSVHFELLIHLNVNYLNFKVRQTDLFLIMCPSVSFLTARVSLNILVSKIFARTMKWQCFQAPSAYLHPDTLFSAQSISSVLTSFIWLLSYAALHCYL